MNQHEKWLEMVSLDAIGQLPSADRDALLQHLGSCRECSIEARALIDVAQNWLPAASKARAPFFGRNEREERNAFISRAQAEGLRFSAEAKRSRGAWLPAARSWDAVLAGSVATAVCGVLAFALWRTHVEPTPHTHPVTTGSREAELALENQQLRSQLSATKGQLEAEHSKVTSLETMQDEASRHSAQLHQLLVISQKQAADAREQLSSAVANSTEEAKRLAADLQQLNSLRAELDEVKSARASDQATLAERQYKVEELTQQLQLERASVERERKMMTADRDIRDLMSAKDLHIVDVHDIDPNGKKRKAFGRMFYTEGKSLIFYAYDLDPKSVKNASFQVWGQKADDQREAVSLGILYTDDQKQSRWMMKFDDPKVLNEIDSIFVTVEAPGGSKKPSGKKMMFAYLMNDPNHP